jgi:hypothetical protein
MEQLDAAVFDVLLKFLTPKDAGRLGAVSRTQRRLVDGSLWWKEWCEQDSPSLKAFPASEIVEFHYNKDGGRGYKRLLSKLVGGFCSESKPCQCSKSTGRVALPESEAYVMLMDVYVRGEAVLSCSADGADLDKDYGDQYCWPGNVRKLSRAVVKAEQTDERLFSVTQEMKKFLNPVDQDDIFLGRVMPPDPPYYRAQDVLHYSWKVMRKSDGRLLRLVDEEPATYTDARAGSGGMLVNLGAAQGDLNVARGFYVLRAVAPLKDADDLEWPWLEEPYRAVMRLRCHVVESFDDENHTFPDTSDGFSIEVGLAKQIMADNCFYHDMAYLSNELCRMFLKNSYWR